MLEHPVDPPVLATKLVAVTIREVRAISRKGSRCDSAWESSETIRQTRVRRVEMIWPDLHGDMQSATEMIAPSPDEKNAGEQ